MGRTLKFQKQLKFGKVGESRIARWLMSKGYSVLPVYEKELAHGKGPVVYSVEQNLIAPDMLAYRKGKAIWIEAKTKSNFTWHRLSNEWVTGIDLRHYEDYIKIAEKAPWPVWILFLHLNTSGAKDTPAEQQGKSPVGLFGNDLKLLIENEHHRHTNWGKSGMVYWSRNALKLIANAEDLIRCGR